MDATPQCRISQCIFGGWISLRGLLVRFTLTGYIWILIYFYLFNFQVFFFFLIPRDPKVYSPMFSLSLWLHIVFGCIILKFLRNQSWKIWISLYYSLFLNLVTSLYSNEDNQLQKLILLKGLQWHIFWCHFKFSI